MKNVKVHDTHNFALVGHSGDGKTSVGETLLHQAGATPTLGSVTNGTSVLNFLPEEKERHTTISSSIYSFDAGGKHFTLVDTPGDLGFVRYRNLIPDLPAVRSTLEELIRSGHRVVLIEDGDWFDTEVTSGLAIRPFPDAGGHFGGFPESDDAACRELAAAVEAGATAVVVGWPAQWWFEHLPGLRAALSEWATSVHTDRLVETFTRTPVPAS